MDCEKHKQINRREAIDAVRLYEGDIRIRDEEGNLVGRQSSDPFYGDKNAYRTLNALLFPGIINEISRIQKEGKQLNPVFLEKIDETIDLYCRIFQLMCWEHRKSDREWVIAKRVERLNSLALLEQGQALSFISASKAGYDEEFAKKDGVILIEMHISPDVPYLDFEKALGSEYKNIGEREVLLAPFVDLEINEMELTLKEKRTIRDINGNLPVGKYRIDAIGIQDCQTRDKVAVTLEAVKNDVFEKRYIPLEAVNAMNKGEWDKDFSEYIKWKEELQRYLRYKLSDMWYRGNDFIS